MSKRDKFEVKRITRRRRGAKGGRFGDREDRGKTRGEGAGGGGESDRKIEGIENTQTGE